MAIMKDKSKRFYEKHKWEDDGEGRRIKMPYIQGTIYKNCEDT
jgi:hypothetical protein